MPSLRMLTVALLTLPLAACGADSPLINLAERTPETVPLPPAAETSADDGVLATAAKQATLEDALDNETRGWRNPSTGSFGTVTPLRTTGNGGCREYRETVVHDGREATRGGTACKNAAGLWVVTRD